MIYTILQYTLLLYTLIGAVVGGLYYSWCYYRTKQIGVNLLNGVWLAVFFSLFIWPWILNDAYYMKQVKDGWKFLIGRNV